MVKKYRIGAMAAALFMLLAIACNKTSDDVSPSNDLDRQPMLSNYANNYIVPAYADMVAKLTTLRSNIQTFTNAPDNTTKEAAINSFRAAYTTWQKVDMLEFGPAEDVLLRSYVNTYPVTVSKLDGNISSGSYDLETFGSKDAQGFPAIDYLLNGLDVSMYTTDANASNRKQYLLAVVDKMLEKVNKVNSDWATYKENFIANTATDANSSISIMVNNYVMYYERYLRGGKVGLPVGAMTGIAKADISEAYYSQELAKEFVVTALTAVRDFYSGKSYSGASSGEGMKSYLAALGTTDNNGMLMADVVETEMNQAITAVGSLNGTIVEAVNNNRTQVLEAYEEVQDVVPLLKVDMVSAFSISITYTDNDGD